MSREPLSRRDFLLGAGGAVVGGVTAALLLEGATGIPDVLPIISLQEMNLATDKPYSFFFAK